jgi:hypothetical protein
MKNLVRFGYASRYKNMISNTVITMVNTVRTKATAMQIMVPTAMQIMVPTAMQIMVPTAIQIMVPTVIQIMATTAARIETATAARIETATAARIEVAMIPLVDDKIATTNSLVALPYYYPATAAILFHSIYK